MIDKINKILSDGIAKYAKMHQVAKDQVQLFCSLNDDESLLIEVMKGYQRQTPRQFITSLELMDKKIDFTGVSTMIDMFVPKKLKAVAERARIPLSDVGGMIIGKSDDEHVVWVYNKTKPVTELSIEQLLV